MAHGDPVFCRLDIDKILTGEKISTLDERQFKVYVTLWALAVKHRTYVLSRATSTPEYIQGSAKLRARKGMRSTKVILQELAEIGLIEIMPSGRINVIGVKEVHPKLLWDRCPENVPITDPI
jgi:hypothetical protein